MKLILFSGGDFDDNHEMNRELVGLMKKRRPLVTYIPSCFEDSDHYYEEFIDFYSNLGIRHYNIFHVDKPFSRRELHLAFAADAIYLAGGNTFYFLHHLKESGVLPRLAKFAKKGGVLFGESAGSIIMTPHIRTASYPIFDRDDNDIKLRDWQSLGLVDFEFFPHFDPDDADYVTEIAAQSKKTPFPIYAVADGSGIVVRKKKTTFIGKIWCFYQGETFKI